METKNDFPDFSGRCISLCLIDDDTNHDLIEPRFEMQGGRPFIIGTVPLGATQSDWVANRQAGIAWDQVTEYFLFDSVEQYTEAVKKSESVDKKD